MSSSSSPSASSSSESSSTSPSSSHLQLLFQISPDLVQSESRIGAHVAFNRLYLAFVVDSCTLKLVAHEPSNHSLSSSSSSSPLFAHAVLDSPHRDRAAQPQAIKCIKLSHLNDSPDCLLLSCASSSVLLWNMNEVFVGGGRGAAAAAGAGAVVVGEPGWFPRHDIHECAFHASNKIVGVACRSGLVVVIDVERNVRLDEIVLDACVNVFEFARFAASSLVLISSTETNLLVLHDFRSRSRRQLVRASSPSSSSSSSLERSAIVDICGLDNEPLVVLGKSSKFFDSRVFST